MAKKAGKIYGTERDIQTTQLNHNAHTNKANGANAN